MRGYVYVSMVSPWSLILSGPAGMTEHVVPVVLLLIGVHYVGTQTLPGLSPGSQSICYGATADTFFSINCNEEVPSGAKLAVSSVKVGAKPSSLSCPLELSDNDVATDVCCHPNVTNDCIFDYTGSFYRVGCTGKSLCNIQAGRDDTSKADCYDAATYETQTNYMNMGYYCVPESQVNDLCGSVTVSASNGDPVYLRSNEYPSGLATQHSLCTCSVEIENCTSGINVYTIDRRFQNTSDCRQYLTVTDGDVLQNFTCTDNIDAVITQTLNTNNYMRLELHNALSEQGGVLWTGFTAGDGTSDLRVTCPAEDRQFCLPPSTTTTTTTTSTTTTPTTTTTTTTTTTATSTTSTTTTSTPTTTTTTTTQTTETTPIAPETAASSEKSDTLGLIIGVAVEGLIIIVLIIVVVTVVCLKKRSNKDATSSDKNDTISETSTTGIPSQPTSARQETHQIITNPQPNGDTNSYSNNNNNTAQSVKQPIHDQVNRRHIVTEGDTHDGTRRVLSPALINVDDEAGMSNTSEDQTSPVYTAAMMPITSNAEMGIPPSSTVGTVKLKLGLSIANPGLSSHNNTGMVHNTGSPPQPESSADPLDTQDKKKKKKKKKHRHRGEDIVEDNSREAEVDAFRITQPLATVGSFDMVDETQQNGDVQHEKRKKKKKHKRHNKDTSADDVTEYPAVNSVTNGRARGQDPDDQTTDGLPMFSGNKVFPIDTVLEGDSLTEGRERTKKKHKKHTKHKEGASDAIWDT